MLIRSVQFLRSICLVKSPSSLIQHRSVVTRNPVRLAYTEIDDPTHRSADADRTPVVVLHGLFGSNQNWRSVGKALNARLKRRVVLADLRNHGDSPHVDIMTYSEMASDLGQLVAEVSRHTDRAILLGHSLGGFVCTYFALTKPRRVEKLIIEDVAPRSYGGGNQAPWSYISLMKGCRWQASTLSGARKEVGEQLAKQIESSDTRQFLLMNLVEKNGSIGWRLNLDALENNRHILCMFPQEKLLGKKYDGPTLAVRGANSHYIRDDDAALFNTFFPQVRMETIEGAGHWIHSEQPAKFIDCISQFINES